MTFSINEYGKATTFAFETISVAATGISNNELLIAVVSDRSGNSYTGPIATISDNNGGIWTLADGYDNLLANGGARHSSAVYYRVYGDDPDDTGGNLTVSISPPGTRAIGLYVFGVESTDAAYEWGFLESAVNGSGTATLDGTSSGSTAGASGSGILELGLSVNRAPGTFASGWVDTSGISFTQTGAKITERGAENTFDWAAAIQTAEQTSGTKSTTVTSNETETSEGTVYILLFENTAAGGDNVAVLTAASTDSAVGLGVSLGAEAGIETDAALAVNTAEEIIADLAAESDTALALTGDRTEAPQVAPETDEALVLNITLAAGTGLTEETDSAVAVSVGTAGSQSEPVITAAATEIAQGLSLAMAAGQVAESATALQLGASVSVAVGSINEIDTSFSPSLALSLGAPEERDVAPGVIGGEGTSAVYGPLLGKGPDAGRSPRINITRGNKLKDTL